MYEFYRAEVRDGFYVDGMMKRNWAAQLDELKLFDKVCRKYGLRWFADCGTLLGAVRHKGFIPWDDDIDVCMLRDDYEKFRSIMYDEYPSDYAIICYDARKSEYRNWDNLTRIINRLSPCFDTEYLNAHHQCPYPAGIDIFPFDFIPDDEEECREYKDLCTLVYTAMNPEGGFRNLPEEQQEGLINALEQTTGYRFDMRSDLRMQIFRLGEAIFSMYHRDECSRVVMMGYALSAGAHVYEKSWFEGEEHYLPFENTLIPVTSDTDGHLKAEYGSGYMTQYRGGFVHSYPFYGEAEQQYIDWLGYDPYYCHYDISEIPEQRVCDRSDRKVLFIIPRATDWKYMEGYYETLRSAGVSVEVMPIPYYDIDFYRNRIQTNYEYEGFSDELPLVKYTGTDINDDSYDEIVISFPYDQYNYTEDIADSYYAASLRDRTQMLTYISSIVTDDRQAMSIRDQTAMTHYVPMPGVILSDNVYVQSEAVKNAYIKRLCDSVSGDDREIEKLFSKKIQIGVNK